MRYTKVFIAACGVFMLTSCDNPTPTSPSEPETQPVRLFQPETVQPPPGATLTIRPSPYEERIVIGGTYTLPEEQDVPVWIGIVLVSEDGSSGLIIAGASGKRALFRTGTIRIELLVSDYLEDLAGNRTVNAMFLVGATPMTNSVNLFERCGEEFICIDWPNLSHYELLELNYRVQQ